MKKFRILVGAVALAVVIATIIACTKEKETKVVQQVTETEEIGRKPIAIFDVSSGIMHDDFDLDYANSVMNENSCTKESAYRFLVESAEIIDSVPADNESEIIRKIVILDTEEETSIACWFIGDFVDKVIQTDCVFYYVNEEVSSGVYEFSMSSNDAVYAVYVNGSTYTFEEVEQLPEKAMGKNIVVCIGRNCQSGCSLTSNKDNCTPCIPNPGQQGDCYKLETSNQLIGQILRILMGGSDS
jgi:hypothetical protein